MRKILLSAFESTGAARGKAAAQWSAPAPWSEERAASNGVGDAQDGFKKRGNGSADSLVRENLI